MNSKALGSAYLLGTIGLGAALLIKKRITGFEQPEVMDDAERIDQIYQKTFPNSEDLHFTKEDILLIGRCIVGLRHVSSEELAHKNATQGFKNGCSINASFVSGNDTDSNSITAYLDDHVRDGKDCSLEIQQYENLLMQFIRASVGMDIENRETVAGQKSYWHRGTRFMVVAHGGIPSKCPVFFGIGRLGPTSVKNPISPEKVFLLQPPTSDELKIPQNISDSCRERLLRERVARVYLSRFIQFIRTEFNPAKFQVVYGTHHYLKCASSLDKTFCLEQFRSIRSTVCF